MAFVSAKELLANPEAFKGLGPKPRPAEPDHADLRGELMEEFPSYARRTHRGDPKCR
jgi:hypothetical protein